MPFRISARAPDSLLDHSITRVTISIERIRRKNDHPVVIRHHEVAGMYSDPFFQRAADPNRGLARGDAPAPNRLCRSFVAGQHGHFNRPQKSHVANSTVYNHACTSPRQHRASQQVAKAAHAQNVVACPNRYHTRRHGIDCLELGAIPAPDQAEIHRKQCMPGP